MEKGRERDLEALKTTFAVTPNFKSSFNSFATWFQIYIVSRDLRVNFASMADKEHTRNSKN